MGKNHWRWRRTAGDGEEPLEKNLWRRGRAAGDLEMMVRSLADKGAASTRPSSFNISSSSIPHIRLCVCVCVSLQQTAGPQPSVHTISSSPMSLCVELDLTCRCWSIHEDGGQFVRDMQPSGGGFTETGEGESVWFLVDGLQHTVLRVSTHRLDDCHTVNLNLLYVN